MTKDLCETARRALDAYGGAARWQAATRVRAVVSARGLAFTLKRRPPLERAEIVCDLHRPFARLTPIGERPDVSGVLDGADTRLESPGGEVLEQRRHARGYFPYQGGRFWRWDDLDMAYFANYAFWGYLTLPALLTNPAIDWSEPAPGYLRGRFPCHIPAHCAVQEFRFDPETGLLRQQNYTAQIIGAWAKAANVVTAYARTGGLTHDARRRVTPRGPGASPLPGPALIAIDVHEFELEPA